MRSFEASDGNVNLVPGPELFRQTSPLARQVSRPAGTAIVSFLETQKSATLEDSNDDTDRYRRICGCWWSGNQRVLLVTAVLFFVLTCCQTVAADMSKSEALLADCVSMGVDTLTYMLHIFGESLKGKRCHRPVEVVVPAVSLGTLTFFTVWVLLEAINTLRGERDLWGDTDDGNEDDVDPWIVLLFALINIIIDAISMLYFYWNAKQSGSQGINMMAAFLLVGADFARGFACLFESILIISLGYNSTHTDAWCCCLVSLTILLGAGHGIYEWTTDACGGGDHGGGTQSTTALPNPPDAVEWREQTLTS